MPNEPPKIRKPAVAGLFYPASPIELSKTIADFFASVEKPAIAGRPLALVAPHAGYPYSGRIAARAYKLLEGEQFDTVVVISPSHTVFFKGSSVYDGDGYETPLGLIETDRAMSEKIAGINPSVTLSNMGHASGRKRGEHALEVQLPFLQIALGKFKLVAIVMGDQEEESIRSLGETLASALVGSNSLMIASTDLSHFHSEKEARRLDFAVQTAIEQYDYDLLLKTLESGSGEACGGGPVAAVMMATRRLGGSEVKSLDYTTSAEVTGEFDEVVGYLSAAIVGGTKVKTSRRMVGSLPAGKDKEIKLRYRARRQLLQIARDAIAAHLSGKEYKPADIESLSGDKGLFVTLHLDNELRGCIGQIKTRQALPQAVAEMALAAAFEDPRFQPLTEPEFDKLSYEISVLSPLERVTDFDRIEIGRDGLMIKLDLHSGLLLPQVAADHGWDTTEFLEQTCLKAGLPKKTYQSPRAEVYRFSAEVFGD